jgi:WD40 repeat protein
VYEVGLHGSGEHCCSAASVQSVRLRVQGPCSGSCSSSSLGAKTITALAAHPEKPYFVSTATDGWLRVWPYADSQYVNKRGAANRPSNISSWESELKTTNGPQHLHCAAEIEMTAADGWRRHATCLAFSPFSRPIDRPPLHTPSNLKAVCHDMCHVPGESTDTDSNATVVDLACGLVSGDIVIVEVTDTMELRMHGHVRASPPQSASIPGVTNAATRYSASPGVYALSYSPDGRWLAAASARLTVILDAQNHYRVLARCYYRGHTDVLVTHTHTHTHTGDKEGQWHISWETAPSDEHEQSAPSDETGAARGAVGGQEGGEPTRLSAPTRLSVLRLRNPKEKKAETSTTTVQQPVVRVWRKKRGVVVVVGLFAFEAIAKMKRETTSWVIEAKQRKALGYQDTSHRPRELTLMSLAASDNILQAKPWDPPTAAVAADTLSAAEIAVPALMRRVSREGRDVGEAPPTPPATLKYVVKKSLNDEPTFRLGLEGGGGERWTQVFAGHGSPVSGATFSPDGRVLVTAGAHDSTILQWTVQIASPQT